MKYLIPYFKKYLKECLLSPLFKMLEALFDLTVPLVVAKIIDKGIAGGDTQYIIGRCGILVLMAFAGLVCSFIAQYFAARASVGTATELRYRLLEHIQSLSFSELDSIGSATLITRMTGDTDKVQSGLNMFLRLLLRSPFIVFGSMIMAFTINVKAALVFAVAIPVMFAIVFGIMRITSPKYKKAQSQLDKVTTAVRENLSGVRVIRAFGREKTEIEDFDRAGTELATQQIKVGNISSLINPLTSFVINISIIAILYVGAGRVNEGVLLSGDIVALINYMSQILIELVKLANLITLLSKAMSSMDRIAQVLDTKSSMEFPEKTAEIGETDEAVRFENVCMKYKNASGYSLENITFTAEKGQKIGIIGSTGSGKTSLAGLVARHYDAEKGKIFLFGIPIEKYDSETLRKTVGVVMQKSTLFSGTVRSNLLWGNENANDEELWEALRAAQAEEFVRAKPKDLDEYVEQGGRNLSGGQRQRLNIARTLVSKPKILILDDSSSALDYATDKKLRSSLSELDWNCTVFSVSQRAAGIMNADKILVLDDGVLCGVGTHEELLRNCGVYREIYESQFKKEDGE